MASVYSSPLFSARKLYWWVSRTTAKEHQAALNKERVVRMHILREHLCCSAGRRRGASSPICSGDRTGIWDSHILQDFVNQRTRARAHPLRATMTHRQSGPRAIAPTRASRALSAAGGAARGYRFSAERGNFLVKIIERQTNLATTLHVKPITLLRKRTFEIYSFRIISCGIGISNNLVWNPTRLFEKNGFRKFVSTDRYPPELNS